MFLLNLTVYTRGGTLPIDPAEFRSDRFLAHDGRVGEVFEAAMDLFMIAGMSLLEAGAAGFLAFIVFGFVLLPVLTLIWLVIQALIDATHKHDDEDKKGPPTTL